MRTSTVLKCEKYTKSFYMPFYWKTNIDLIEHCELFNSMRKSQIILKNFEVKKENKENDVFNNYEANLNLIKDIYSQRKNINECLQKVCKKYGFRNETFFKSIQVFDNYVHKVINKYFSQISNSFNNTDRNNRYLKINLNNQNIIENLKNELFLVSVLCLNIACKIEEVNCNYLIFFKENILHNKNKNINYSIKELTNKEAEILKILNFKVNTPNFYEFNNIFIQLYVNEFSKYCENENNFDENKLNEIFKLLITYNDNITKSYSYFNESVFNSPLTSGLICFEASCEILLHHFKNENFYFLENICKRVNKILFSFIKNLEYIEKVKVESMKVLYRIRINNNSEKKIKKSFDTNIYNHDIEMKL